MSTTINNNQLLKEISEGSEFHFEYLFKLYYTKLLGFTKSFIIQTDVSEDIVLEVFSKIWEKRKQLINVKNIDVFLYVSVKNASINFLNKKKKIKFSYSILDVDLVRYSKSSDEELITTEMLEELNKVVNELPNRCKLIFKMIREDGLTKSEVANILDLSTKTIDNQISIAVKKIAENLNIDTSNPKNIRILTSFLL
jgi:RNA polymerase sigma-70 factor (ECF subfamily)